jgi:hypothetical protein
MQTGAKQCKIAVKPCSKVIKRGTEKGKNKKRSGSPTADRASNNRGSALPPSPNGYGRQVASRGILGQKFTYFNRKFLVDGLGDLGVKLGLRIWAPDKDFLGSSLLCENLR